MAFHVSMPFHSGEEKIQTAMGGPESDNPTQPLLSMQAARMLQVAPLIAIGTLDAEGRPWTTVWGGGPGLSQPLGNSMIGVKTFVDRAYDPVVEVLFGENADGEVVREQAGGRMIGGLAIDLVSRKRVKMYGRMVAGAVAAIEDDEAEEMEESDEQRDSSDTAGHAHPETSHQIQLVCRIDQSLGNCPKYLNQKHITPAKVDSSLLSDSADLSPAAIEHIQRSDLFFISSSHSTEDMDTNHRGGPPGFVRTARSPETGTWTLYWPEYSGNRLYQTLGNLAETPLAGLVFPDFNTGDVLYLTGQTEVLLNADAARTIPHSNLAVALTVTSARHVARGLPFRGSSGEQSPYNPRIRPLATESPIDVQAEPSNSATLLSKTQITPTINRYKFSLSNPGSWTAGQWVALDLSHELDLGYSHMRDDDPTSINDDFIRTFTVSSPPPLKEDDRDVSFELTVRTVGNVTQFLSRQRGGGGAPLEVPVRGFGGQVMIEQEEGKVTPVVAGGVGITPLMAQLLALDPKRLRVWWTLSVEDVGLAVDVLERVPAAAKCFELFFTGTNKELGKETTEALAKLEDIGASCQLRRLQKEDLEKPGLSDRWHVCVSLRLRTSLSEWLVGKEMVFEDFNF